jgi:hypothetical protein
VSKQSLCSITENAKDTYTMISFFLHYPCPNFYILFTEYISFAHIDVSIILGGQIVMGNTEKYQTRQKEIFH